VSVLGANPVKEVKLRHGGEIRRGLEFWSTKIVFEFWECCGFWCKLNLGELSKVYHGLLVMGCPRTVKQ
jgi:hypothetical protein